VYNLSITIALYALAMFWVATNDDLKPYRPMPKVKIGVARKQSANNAG
jgi:hypothetical protein